MHNSPTQGLDATEASEIRSQTRRGSLCFSKLLSMGHQNLLPQLLDVKDLTGPDLVQPRSTGDAERFGPPATDLRYSAESAAKGVGLRRKEHPVKDLAGWPVSKVHCPATTNISTYEKHHQRHQRQKDLLIDVDFVQSACTLDAYMIYQASQAVRDQNLQAAASYWLI